VVQDDAQVIGRRMNEAAALIVGSPTHFNNMSSPPKALLDRNGTNLFEETSFMPKANHKGKPAIVVTANMSPNLLSLLFGIPRGTIKSIKVYLKYGGFKTIGTIIKSNIAKSTDLSLSLTNKIKIISNRLENKLLRA